MRALKVRELIELLQQQDPEHDVYADQMRMCPVIDVDYESQGPNVFLCIMYPCGEDDYGQS